MRITRTAPVSAAAFVASVLAGTTFVHAPDARAAQATDPVQVDVFAGAAYDDNLYRLENGEEGLATIGTDELDDWYRYVGAGFKGNFAGDRRHLDIDAEIYRQTYDTFDSLDHTGGHFNATGEWELSGDTRGELGYQFERKLQSFTNKDQPNEDMIRRHTIDAAIERTLAQRWQIRLKGDWSDLNFSSSDFLDKQVADAEMELQYAASQHSTFGLLGTYTVSDFDTNDPRDFSGWSVGPSFKWQLTSSFRVTANVGYTHRGLDHPGDLHDYDGVTGYVASLWAPGDRFSSEIRAFRDVSDLGGEVSEYTERTGLRWQPTWQVTPKLSTRFSLAYERRDFTVIEGAEDRKDDYLLTDLWLDFQATQRLLLSLGYTYETRDSNIDDQEFDDNMVRGELRFSF